jgi:GNAT superfamily N-acetyltransferase
VTIDSVSVSGGTLHLLNGREAAGREADLVALRDEVVGSGDADFPRRLGVWRRQPGFLLAEVRHGGYPVGYACGMPLRPSTDWWRDLTAPLPAAVTTEHPGRTFALTQLLVRASWRRQGIGAELHDLILDDRAEERATVRLPPGAVAAQAAFRNWGWAKVGRSRGAAPGPGPAAPGYDVLVRPARSSGGRRS